MSGVHDRAWQQLVTVVMDTRGDWRRKVTEATGLPFSRIRALKRLADGPLGLRELAESMSTDAPAATVTVNDLEDRKLVRRQPHPSDGRAKVVSLTAAGKRMLEKARAVSDQAPPAFASLSAEESAVLQRLFDRLGEE